MSPQNDLESYWAEVRGHLDPLEEDPLPDEPPASFDYLLGRLQAIEHVIHKTVWLGLLLNGDEVPLDRQPAQATPGQQGEIRLFAQFAVNLRDITANQWGVWEGPLGGHPLWIGGCTHLVTGVVGASMHIDVQILLDI